MRLHVKKRSCVDQESNLDHIFGKDVSSPLDHQRGDHEASASITLQSGHLTFRQNSKIPKKGMETPTSKALRAELEQLEQQVSRVRDRLNEVETKEMETEQERQRQANAKLMRQWKDGGGSFTADELQEWKHSYDCWRSPDVGFDEYCFQSICKGCVGCKKAGRRKEMCQSFTPRADAVFWICQACLTYTKNTRAPLE